DGSLPPRAPARLDGPARPRRQGVPRRARPGPGHTVRPGVGYLLTGPDEHWDQRLEKMSRMSYASVRCRCDGSASDQGGRVADDEFDAGDGFDEEVEAEEDVAPLDAKADA